MVNPGDYLSQPFQAKKTHKFLISDISFNLAEKDKNSLLKQYVKTHIYLFF